MWPFKRKASPPSGQEDISQQLKYLKDQRRKIQRHLDLSNELDRVYKGTDTSTWDRAEQICRDLIKEEPTWRAHLLNENRRLTERGTISGPKAKPYVLSEMRHKGFEQLAIILEKRGQFDEAILVSEEARARGWGRNWDSRIARLRKKAQTPRP